MRPCARPSSFYHTANAKQLGGGHGTRLVNMHIWVVVHVYIYHVAMETASSTCNMYIYSSNSTWYITTASWCISVIHFLLVFGGTLQPAALRGVNLLHSKVGVSLIDTPRPWFSYYNALLSSFPPQFSPQTLPHHTKMAEAGFRSLHPLAPPHPSPYRKGSGNETNRI